MASSRPPVLERLYDRLFSEVPGNRHGEGISESACRETPRNFFLQIVSLSLTKLGDALANPKTVLVWMLDVLGAPLVFVGWLVPIRESLSMLPQAGLAAWVIRFPIRKWIWVVGSLIQGLAVLGMAGAALLFEGAVLGWAILGSLIGFSLARAFCSIAIKDVMGKTVAQRRRGRLSGWSASVAGGLTLAAGVLLIGPLQDSGESGPFIAILAGGAGLWFLAAATFSRIREFPESETETNQGGSSALRQIGERLRILADEREFRLFVLARALFLVSALAAPYLVVLARQENEGRGVDLLGWMVFAGGLGDMLSSPFWGKSADRSSRRAMMGGAALAVTVGLGCWAMVAWGGRFAGQLWPWVIGFFLLSVAHAGVRAGRKTYVVDMATGNRRTDFVSVSNTVIGLAILLAGLIASVADWLGAERVLLGLSVAGALGIAVASRLPEVEEFSQRSDVR